MAAKALALLALCLAAVSSATARELANPGRKLNQYVNFGERRLSHCIVTRHPSVHLEAAYCHLYYIMMPHRVEQVPASLLCMSACKAAVCTYQVAGWPLMHNACGMTVCLLS